MAENDVQPALNRAARRQAKNSKLRLTKKTKKVRGKTFYGGTNITEYKNLDLFEHAYTMKRLGLLNITPEGIQAMQREREATDRLKSKVVDAEEAEDDIKEA